MKPRPMFRPLPVPPFGSLLVCVAVAGGCALPTDGGRAAGWLPGGPGGGADVVAGVRRATAEDPVVQVAAFWQAAEGVGPAGTPVRGFAGRILLTTAGGADPVAANGAVRLYLFSDDGDRGDRAAPVNQIDLAPEAWAARGAMSSLGPGYEVFVPYPKRADHAVRCSLRVRFTPVGEDGEPGRPLFSPAVGCTLDGPPAPGGGDSRQRHTLVTETFRGPDVVPVRVDPATVLRAAAEEAGAADRRVTPAAATAPAAVPPTAAGAGELPAVARARIDAALAAYRRRAGEDARRPDFSRTRSRFLNADAVAAVADADRGRGDADGDEPGWTTRRRFSLTPPPGRPAARDAGASDGAPAADPPPGPADEAAGAAGVRGG